MTVDASILRDFSREEAKVRVRGIRYPFGRWTRVGFSVALVVALIATSLTAVGVTGAPAEKALVIAMGIGIETMDPAKTAKMYGPPSMIYETLIARDLTGAYVPALAESWNMNRTDPEHPTFEIKLKEGVSFHDGTTFDSDAVKRIIVYYAHPDSWVQYVFWSVYGCLDGTGWPDQGIWCKDTYNLVLNLTWADQGLEFNLSNLYGAMISPTAAENDGHANYGTPSGSVVGTGPFKMQEWVAGDHVTLIKNEGYNWGASWYSNKGPASIDKIIYREIQDEPTRLAAFESGSVNVLQEVPPSKIQTYQDEPEIDLITGPGQGVYYVEFNCMKDPWTKPDLRRAFGYAINRTQILNVVWHGIGEEGVNYLPPIEPESTRVPAMYNYSYDPDMASSLFAAAGYSDEDSDGWLEMAGEELTLELWTTNRAEEIAMSEIVHNQFEDAGVHVTLTQYTLAQLMDLAASGMQQAILFSYSWPRAETLDWHLGSWAMGGANTAWYSDSVFDDYVTNWTYAETQQEFSDNVTLAHIRLLTQGPWAPMLYWHQIDAVHSNVTGWYTHPYGQEQPFDILDVDVAEPVSPPELTITSPLDGTVVTVPFVYVIGTTDPNATLTVNGFGAAVESDGSFQVIVPLVDGSNEISAVATLGETATVTIYVIFEDPIVQLLQEISELVAQIDELQTDLEAANASIVELNASQTLVKEQLWLLENETEELMTQLGTAIDDLESANSTIGLLQAEIESLNDDLNNTRDQLEFVSSALLLLENEILSLEDELNDTRDELDAANTEIEDRDQTIHDLEMMQIVLLAVVIVLLVLLAIMYFVMARMKNGRAPPSE